MNGLFDASVLTISVSHDTTITNLGRFNYPASSESYVNTDTIHCALSDTLIVEVAGRSFMIWLGSGFAFDNAIPISSTLDQSIYMVCDMFVYDARYRISSTEKFLSVKLGDDAEGYSLYTIPIKRSSPIIQPDTVALTHEFDIIRNNVAQTITFNDPVTLVTLYSVVGNPVAAFVNTSSTVFNAANLPAGVYILNARGSKSNVSKKIILP